jgi:hypothetical protein
MKNFKTWLLVGVAANVMVWGAFSLFARAVSK